MVKIDTSHDYYADLELPADAGIEDIKKQFRKLALKYHPDRNPGKELEYSPRFQAIQAAHEVLADAEQRAKYDAGRRRPAMPESMRRPTPPSRPSGAPYQANSDFPPPRMRTNNNTSSPGAERYTNFGPPPPKRNNQPNGGQGGRDRTNAYTAWEHMRETQKAQSARQQSYAQQTGHQSPRPRPANPPPDDSRPGRRRSGSEESSQRAPYEEARRQRPPPDRPVPPKAPPRPGFDPANAAADERPAATHTHYNRPSRRSPPPPPPPQMPGAYPPPRTKAQGQTAQAPTARRPHPDHLPHLPNLNTQDPPFVEGSRVHTPYMSHSGEKTYFSSDGLKAPLSATRSRQDDPLSSDSHPPQRQDRRQSDSPPHKTPARNGTGRAEEPSHSFDIPSSSENSDETDIESGLSGSDLKHKPRPKAQPSASWAKRSTGGPLPRSKSFEGSQANGTRPNLAQNAAQPPQTIFTFDVTPETFQRTSAPPRSQSPAHIDTNFSKSNEPVSFHSGDGAVYKSPTKDRHPAYFPSRERNADSFQAPTSNFYPTSPPLFSAQSPRSPPAHPSAGPAPFSADHWKSQLQEDNWASQWAQGPPPSIRLSPTRSGSTTRKARGGGVRAPVSETGTPSLQPNTPEPTTGEGQDYGSSGGFRSGRAAGMDGDAMDIDSTPPPVNDSRPPTADSPSTYPHPPMAPPPPPVQQQQQPQSQQQQRYVPDNITKQATQNRPPEPRRASYPNIVSPPPDGPPPARNRAPTLDMNGFRHVPPFQTRAVSTGLEDLKEISSDLPFLSQPASNHPGKTSAQSPQRELPKIPRGPVPPERLDQATWHTYILHMTQYLTAWNAFNKQMADYFYTSAERQIEMEKGPAGGMVEGWLQARGETSSLGGWDSYVKGQVEQQRMRMHWTAAFERHMSTLEVHSRLRERLIAGGVHA